MPCCRRAAATSRPTAACALPLATLASLAARPLPAATAHGRRPGGAPAMTHVSVGLCVVLAKRCSQQLLLCGSRGCWSLHPCTAPSTVPMHPPPHTACYTASLPTTPANALLPAGSCNVTANGSMCATACNAGFTGSPSIACSNGSWDQSWNGNCTSEGALRGVLRCLPHSVGIKTSQVANVRALRYKKQTEYAAHTVAIGASVAATELHTPCRTHPQCCHCAPAKHPSAPGPRCRTCPWRKFAPPTRWVSAP